MTSKFPMGEFVTNYFHYFFKFIFLKNKTKLNSYYVPDPLTLRHWRKEFHLCGVYIRELHINKLETRK